MAIAALAVGVVCVAIGLFTDGFARWLFLVVAVLSLFAAVAIWITGTVALWMVRRVVSSNQRDLSDAGEAVDDAVAEPDLPTGPMSVLRLVWRLRRGVDDEVARVRAVGDELRERLD